jgi:hypothetical protein
MLHARDESFIAEVATSGGLSRSPLANERFDPNASRGLAAIRVGQNRSLEEKVGAFAFTEHLFVHVGFHRMRRKHEPCVTIIVLIMHPLSLLCSLIIPTPK